jgi:hypothetical protein
MGQAQVRIDAGKVCFAPASAETSRPGALDIQGVFVTNMSVSPVQEVWAVRIARSAGPFQLKPGGCIPYGQEFQGQFVVGPVELVRGTVYSVFLNSKLTDPYDSTRGFTAEFCLLEGPGQQPRVHQIQWDEKAGKWQRDICMGK